MYARPIEIVIRPKFLFQFSCQGRLRIRHGFGVVVGLLNSECSQQNRANENKHAAYRQHIERQGKVIRLDNPKHSNLPSGRRELCGRLSEFDKQLFFKTALIACERAPIGA
jgi:hypothetical protein